MAKDLLIALHDMSAEERKYLVLALEVTDVEPLNENEDED